MSRRRDNVDTAAFPLENESRNYAMSEQGQLPPPMSLALVICEAVYTDSGTGKKTLLGIFQGIAVKEFPAAQPHIAIYLSLTDGHGKATIKVQIVDADESMEPLFVAENEIEFKDPRIIAEVIVGIQNLTFPAAGEYRVQVFANGKHVTERRFVVIQIQEG